MTTEEFIKMLKEADPSGKAHIRMSGGIPIYAEHKPGYWDGPYNYINEEGKYVYSSEGSKVDILCTTLDDFIEENFDLDDINNLDNIKNKIKIDYTYHDSVKREQSIINNVEKLWKEEYEFVNKSLNKSITKSIKNNEEGWTWYQNKLVDSTKDSFNEHVYYTWKIYDLNGTEQGSNIYNIEGVLKSNLFERLDNNKKEGYYQWIIKTIKN